MAVEMAASMGHMMVVRKVGQKVDLRVLSMVASLVLGMADSLATWKVGKKVDH